MKLNNSDVTKVPSNTPAITLHEATLVKSKIISPINMKSVDVSPIDHGIDPKKASNQEYCA